MTKTYAGGSNDFTIKSNHSCERWGHWGAAGTSPLLFAGAMTRLEVSNSSRYAGMLGAGGMGDNAFFLTLDSTTNTNNQQVLTSKLWDKTGTVLPDLAQAGMSVGWGTFGTSRNGHIARRMNDGCILYKYPSKKTDKLDAAFGTGAGGEGVQVNDVGDLLLQNARYTNYAKADMLVRKFTDPATHKIFWGTRQFSDDTLPEGWSGLQIDALANAQPLAKQRELEALHAYPPKPEDTPAPMLGGIAMKNGKQYPVLLLPVDLDIIHPATGEVVEGSEDSTSDYVEKGKGGFVAIRRNADTPLTKLVLRAQTSLPTTSKFRLNIDTTLYSGHIKIWKDQACTQLVTSQQTEFDVGADTTLYLEGVNQGAGGDLKIVQEIKVMNTWYQGDKVSIKVVHAEIPVVLRAFIPHTWTEGEAPFPVDAVIELGPFGTIPFPSLVFSDVLGGDRTGFSLKNYEDEKLFRLKQEIIMTPYKELHQYPDIESKRRADRASLTRYYKRSEDVPLADQGAEFGETFVPGATPNWPFVPPKPTETYEDAGRDGDTTHLTVSLSGGPGSPPWIGWALPNIDTSYKIRMERMESGSTPFIRVTMDVTHDLYPAYEAIVGMPDGTYEAVYQNMPLPDIFPGPNSVGTSMEGKGGPFDIH